MEKNNDNNNHNKAKRRTIMIIIIIIIILSLLTSCGCTAKFWGKIGDLFDNFGDYEINPNTDDYNINLNKDLTFDTNNLQMNLSDENLKISYSYKNINPQEFTCYTTDANIATCYVKDGYVVVNPKSIGSVDIILETITNGEKYQAKTEVTINDIDRFIKLSSYSGTINLNYSKTKIIPYTLINLSGDIKIELSDKNLATAKISNQNLIISCLKPGNINITLKVDFKGHTYTATYNLKIVNEKSSNSTLKSLKTNEGNLNFKSNIYKYYLNVPNSTNKLSFDAIPHDKKSKLTYKLNGKTVDSLTNLPLNTGENKLEITVTAEDGSTTTYDITINRSASTSNTSPKLKNLTVSEGILTPKFTEDNLDYYLNVSSNVRDLDIDAFLKNNKDKITYKFNGEEVSDLQDLPLNSGQNKVEITIEDENGKTTTYTVNINKETSSSSSSKEKHKLSDIEIFDEDLSLNEEFDENKFNYTLDIPFPKDDLTLKGIVKNNKNSKVTYKLNGKSLTEEDLKELELKNGSNKLEIIVTDENGNNATTYTIDIYKNYREIKIPESFDPKIDLDNLENGKANIPYIIIEHTRNNLTGEEIDNFTSSDINVTLDIPNSSNNKGYIEIQPKDNTIGKKDLILEYFGSTDKVTLEFISKEYKIVPESNSYNLDITSDNNSKDIVINNNLFSSTEELESSYNEENNELTICRKDKKRCLTITIPDGLKASYKEGTESLVIEIQTNEPKEYTLEFKAQVNGEDIKTFDVNVNATKKYIITLNSENNLYKGFFDETTTSITLKLAENDTVDLTKYKSYVLIDKENCTYYTIIGYSNKKDNKEITYPLENPLVITKDLTLYAVYKEEKIEPPKNLKSLYLTDVNLFSNPEYLEKYGEDKVIYPGATGSYTMNFTNKTGKTIIINNLMLEEQDPICIDNKGCLNMGYVIKGESGSYYWGESGNRLENSPYKILDHYNQNIISIPNGIILLNNETTQISLNWRWKDDDDSLDTAIGNYVAQKNEDLSINDLYKLIVRIDFYEEDLCSLGANP